MPLLDLLAGPIFGTVKTVVERLVPDKAKAAELQMELTKELMTGALSQAAEQMEINKIEAQNGSVFVSGWRPFIGWVCGMALCYQYVLAPLSIYGASLFGYSIPPPPTLDNSLWELVLGMLGMGAMRTFEKMQGVASVKVTGNIAK